MTSPSRSGTMHLTVETILQGEGWDKGWSQILQMAGNSAQVTERSFGVPDGINNGQFGALAFIWGTLLSSAIALVIGLAAGRSVAEGRPVRCDEIG